MNELIIHLFSPLCIAVHPKRFTIMWGGLSSIYIFGRTNPLRFFGVFERYYNSYSNQGTAKYNKNYNMK